MRRAGSGTTWTSGGAGGGAKQKGENDGAVRIRTAGSKVEVIIIDRAEQRGAVSAAGDHEGGGPGKGQS